MTWEELWMPWLDWIPLLAIVAVIAAPIISGIFSNSKFRKGQELLSKEHEMLDKGHDALADAQTNDHNTIKENIKSVYADIKQIRESQVRDEERQIAQVKMHDALNIEQKDLKKALSDFAFHWERTNYEHKEVLAKNNLLLEKANILEAKVSLLEKENEELKNELELEKNRNKPRERGMER